MSKYNLNEGNESLKKILLLMKYDNQKTLTENVDSMEKNNSKRINEDVGEVAAGAAAVGAGLGAGVVATNTAVGVTSIAPTATTAAVVPVASALGVGLGTAGAIIGGAGALVLAPLVYWLVTKDGEYPKVKALFQMCSTNAEAFKKLPPKLSQSDIRQMSDDIYDAVNYTWGTDEELLFGAFNKLNDGNATDFCALVQYYNKQGENLLSDLNGDIDTSGEWKKIYRPIRNCVEDSLLEIGKMVEDDKIEGVDKKEGSKTSKYKKCSGTYKMYCFNKEVIGKVQKALGLKSDGAYGPKTQAALEKVGYKNGFTDADVSKIVGSTNKTTKEPNVNVGSQNKTTKEPNVNVGGQSQVSSEKENEINNDIGTKTANDVVNFK